MLLEPVEVIIQEVLDRFLKEQAGTVARMPQLRVAGQASELDFGNQSLRPQTGALGQRQVAFSRQEQHLLAGLLQLARDGQHGVNVSQATGRGDDHRRRTVGHCLLGLFGFVEQHGPARRQFVAVGQTNRGTSSILPFAIDL